MKIKVLIVEDEILVAEDLASFLKESGFHISGIAMTADECFSIMEKDRPDILILDILLKGSADGTEIAKILNQVHKTPFIFLTANTDDVTVEKALVQNPGAFISKPFNKRDIKIAVELICQKYNIQSFRSTSRSQDLLNHFLFVKDGQLYRRICISDILYIEAKGSYSVIITKDKSFTLSYNLNHFFKHVVNPLFKKVHRSFVVNLSKVDAFDNTSLRIEQVSIPVSKQYQKSLMEMFAKV